MIYLAWYTFLLHCSVGLFVLRVENKGITVGIGILLLPILFYDFGMLINFYA